MSGTRAWFLVVLPTALFALHNDWWLWSDSSLVAGLPSGLAYHLLYIALTVVVMLLLVSFAWPEELDALEDEQDGAP